MIKSCETKDGGRLLYKFDFLSIKALMSAGELMTKAVAGPSFREKMPPYWRAHSVNLMDMMLLAILLQVGESYALEVGATLRNLV